MKIRTNYVSNSSSSSFIIREYSKLDDGLAEQILNYDSECIEYCRNNGFTFIKPRFCGVGYDPDLLDGLESVAFRDKNSIYQEFFFNNSSRWHFRYNFELDTLEGCTDLDNFDMELWLEELGVEFEFGDEFDFYFEHDTPVPVPSKIKTEGKN